MPRYATKSLFLVLVLLPRLHAAERPGYSGMVRIADNSYLTVNDRKNPIHSSSRLGVLTVTPRDGTVFHPLDVKDWRDEENAPSDLEACCAVPGRAGEYLLAESGHFRKKFGRVFHVRVTRDAEGAWQAESLRALKPYDRELDDRGSTWEGDQVEGLACFPGFAKPILVLGERGGKTKSGHKVGRLVWGELDLTEYRFKRLGEEDLVAKSVLGERDCSDLHMEEKDGTWAVWSVATRDIGDVGPFHSLVYRAGAFVLDREQKTIRFVRENTPADVYHLHGLKVEALAAAPKCVPGSAFSIGTDDESFGGIWRALFKPEPGGR